MPDEPPPYQDEPNEYETGWVPPDMADAFGRAFGGRLLNGRAYKMEDGKVVPARSMAELGECLESKDRTVDTTQINRWVRVSTVFLGVDHGMGGDKPVLWETAVFRSYGPVLIADRYTSLADAKKGHWEIVDQARKHCWWVEWYRTWVGKRIIDVLGWITCALVWAFCRLIGNWHIKRLWGCWLFVLLNIFAVTYGWIFFRRVHWANIISGLFCLYVMATEMFHFRFFWFIRRRKKADAPETDT